MIFELLPIIDTMLELYKKPIGPARFEAYLKLLEGDTKGDMQLPISGFNPMAKEHVTQKLLELKALDAEELMKETLREINYRFNEHPDKRIFKMVMNLADDLKGGWTNRYTTDYDSKFKLNALVTRNFCTPFFWSCENYADALIQLRTKEYALRTLYWLTHSKPITLHDHVEQERFVATFSGNEPEPLPHFDVLDAYYTAHRNSEEYIVIFNFLYGDETCKSLGFPCYGISGSMPGFRYAASVLI